METKLSLLIAEIIVGQLKIGSGNSQVTLSGGANNTLQIGNSAAFSGAFSDLSGKPTTIAGYGITDAFDGVFALFLVSLLL